MDKKKVLFICIHNSARSQMAEAFVNEYGGDKFIAESAGLEPGNLNPYVVDAMAEKGIDISKNKTNSVFDFYKEGRLYDYVVTVCDESNAEKCPVFPGNAKKIHWGFPDPSSFQGDNDDKVEFTRKVRDMIEDKVKEWLKSDGKDESGFEINLNL
ncbi:arsenate reductase ArsC [Haliovirga abyssi]|uniref:Protein-tyrosine-phosphatase n=1 Tax=Haliovirga abyssi TaxID=2996794 RepID=A0AAU9D5L5_9FUSO|nr:arsenate reductase ArsC [Haliovirga abyssi]BDU49833.1 protein-tyrosine-phosphatase [Haliovirga abyssi]